VADARVRVAWEHRWVSIQPIGSQAPGHERRRRRIPAAPFGVESPHRRIGRSTGSDVTKQGWAGLSEAQVAKRLGRALDVAFDHDPIADLGGSAGALAALGEEAWVALQVERKHTHPAENVLQYWPWLERNRRRLVLVHAIAPDARRRTGPRADLTSWLGSMMERVIPGRFTYCRLDLGSTDEPAQLEAAIAAIDGVRGPMEARRLLGQ
jgi:hypothetical protein